MPRWPVSSTGILLVLHPSYARTLIQQPYLRSAHAQHCLDLCSKKFSLQYSSDRWTGIRSMHGPWYVVILARYRA
ncbi:hypothetical protein V8D89_012312 [Ganoderma adspersum]